VPVKHRQPPAIRNPIPCKKQKNEEPPSPSETAREEIERHEEQIARLQADVLRLEEQVQTLLSQRFCLKRFEGSDLDIQFYTGLPSYPVFMCLYRYLEPLLCHLRLCRSDIKSTSTQTFSVSRPLSAHKRCHNCNSPFERYRKFVLSLEVRSLIVRTIAALPRVLSGFFRKRQHSPRKYTLPIIATRYVISSPCTISYAQLSTPGNLAWPAAGIKLQ